MGNALRFLYGNCCKPTTDSGYHGGGGAAGATTVLSRLAHDLYHYEITSQVPDGLGKHVVSSKKAQANWYKKRSDAWRESKPPPQTPEEASRLIILTLKRHQKADVEGLLAYYGLPPPHALVEHTTGPPSSHPQGLKFELHTLPVDEKSIADGDTVTVYVNTADPRESSSLPREIQVATEERAKARAVRNYPKADALHKTIIDAGYRCLNVNNEEVLARKYRIRLSLQVDEKSIADGDTVTVYVNTADLRESSSVPREIQVAAAERAKARAVRNYPKADALHKTIIDAGYRCLNVNNEEVLARKYRIRLRGIDSPESSMPYGKEAKEELAKLVLGKSLRVQVFNQDQYGRCVGDVYCNGIFVQESMLKKGCAWHYKAYDKRPELDKWQEEARAKRVGLWASKNPEMPWEWRKDRRQQRK